MGIHNSIRKYRQEGNVDKARKVLNENREKLRYYNYLNRLAQKLNQLDKRIIRIREHKTYSGAVKREKLDDLYETKNRIAKDYARYRM